MQTPPTMPFVWNEHAGILLNLSATLASGQSFRWRKEESGVWWGVIEKTGAALWQAEGEPNSPLYWQTFPEASQWAVLSDYLRFAVPLETLYAEWIAREPQIAASTVTFRGLRILRQPPIECFFAFQCAACNTVVKIERSVRLLAERYGERLPNPPAPGPDLFASHHREGGDITLYAFPTLEALANADEAVLRGDLWGYRAPRVVNLAREIMARPEGWLESLRTISYYEAKSELVKLHGVGAKLADCICLFALDKDTAVPVDTHVRQIATRLFLPDLCGKSLTPRIYDALAESYRERFGDFAGWAQQYLFFGELHRSREFVTSAG